MFFRVKFTLTDPQTHKEIPNYSVLSHPIRVVSKPDQVKKKIKKRKRAPTDNLMDTLNRIESQQKDQQRLLKRLCVAPFDHSNGKSCDIIKAKTYTIAGFHTETTHEHSTDSFHLAFTEFLTAFKQLPPTDDGAYKVHHRHSGFFNAYGLFSFALLERTLGRCKKS